MRVGKEAVFVLVFILSASLVSAAGPLDWLKAGNEWLASGNLNWAFITGKSVECVSEADCACLSGVAECSAGQCTCSSGFDKPDGFCGDGVCNSGETCSTCRADCGICQILPPEQEPICGDNICEDKEEGTCPQDCQVAIIPPPGKKPFCGDGTCNGEETCSTCTADCGKCQIPPPVEVCSDGTPADSCSVSKPKYCEKGQLADRCSLCGCPEDTSCQKDGTCQKVCEPSKRDGSNYCGIDGQWHVQKESGDTCTNSYECVSNNCEKFGKEFVVKLRGVCQTECYELQDPVCGTDGRTYPNDCYAKRDDVTIACKGKCPCGEPPKGENAFFTFSDGKDAIFVFKLSDDEKIREARDILAGRITDRVHVAGVIVKESPPYNPKWSYYLNSSTIEFFENAAEVCDAAIQYVEDHLSEACNAFLPGCRWCPWDSRLLEEVKEGARGTPFSSEKAACASGCLDEKGNCLPIGVRTSANYCDVDGKLKGQLSAGSHCNNNYECATNLCIESKCTESGFFAKLMVWFKRLL